MAEEHRSGLDPDDYHALTGFAGDWRDTWWDEDYLRFMATQLHLGAVRDAVDLGCGVGHWGQRLLRFMPEARMVGLDAEREWMKKAEVRSQDLGLSERTSYRVAKAEEVPLPDASVDFVTCQTVLIHVADPAAVVREAWRLLRPGGLFLAAEPNNFGSAAAHLVWEPRPDWPVLRDLLELEYTCARGKEALGEGWYSVAERLPTVLDQIGFTGIAARVNNQCHPRIGPDYAADRQSIDILRLGHASGTLMGAGGTIDNGKRQFLAGGGAAQRFTVLWQRALAHQGAQLAAIDAGTASCAGGHLHYLIWGRKPA